MNKTYILILMIEILIYVHLVNIHFLAFLVFVYFYSLCMKMIRNILLGGRVIFGGGGEMGEGVVGGGRVGVGVGIGVALIGYLYII